MRTIFIGGSGRCGTKLLRDVLGKHSKITALPFPTRYTIDPDGLVDTYKALTTGAWSPYIAGVKIKRLWNMLVSVSPNIVPYFVCQDALPHLDRLVQYRTNANWSGGKWWGLADRNADIAKILGDIMRQITVAVLDKHGGEIFVDHNTWNPLFTPELMELCPDSVHVHVYRDPRDVVDSMSGQRWCPDDKLQCAMMYSSVMEQIETAHRITAGRYTIEHIGDDPFEMAKALLEKPHFSEVEFENFVKYPGNVAEGICNMLDIEYEPAMLEPIDAEWANIGRHKSDPIFETPEMVEILQPHMERYGYE